MKNDTLIVWIYVLIISSCTPKSDNGISYILKNDNIHVIDIDKIVAKKNLNTSSLFKNIKTIILENHNDALIGNVDKMYVYGDSIIILDKRIAKGIFIFNKRGEFLKRVGDVGKGPGEYHTPQDFTLNELTKELYVLDSHMDKINTYNLNTGDFIASTKLHDRGKIRTFHIQCVNGKMYGDAYFAKPSNNNYLLREINLENGKENGKWLNKVEYNKGWDEIFFVGESPFIYNNPNTAKYIQLFMDEVITIGSDGIVPFLKLESKNLIETSDLKELSDNDAHLRYSKLNESEKIYNIHNYVEFSDKILFQYLYGNYISVVLYNTTERKCDIFYNIIDDLLYDIDSKNMLCPSFYFSDDKYVYSCINSRQISRFTKLVKNESLSSNLDKREELTELTDNSNPIIFCYEY